MADSTVSPLDVAQLAQDNLTIRIRTIDRAGNVLEDRSFSGAGSEGDPYWGIQPAEPCGSYANAEVAATQYENAQKWESTRESRGWIVDRSYG